MFFGLSLRQFIFSVLACAVAVGLYFLLKPCLLYTSPIRKSCFCRLSVFAIKDFKEILFVKMSSRKSWRRKKPVSYTHLRLESSKPVQSLPADGVRRV